MAQDSTKIDFNSFEVQWDTASEDEKAAIIDNTGHMDPSTAILPVLAGISSFHFTVRNLAKKRLETVLDNIRGLISDPKDREKQAKGLKESASVSSRIYAELHPGLTHNELSFFFRTLLGIEHKGSYFAFKAVYKGLISIGALEKIILNMPQSDRLAIIDRYIQTNPGVRLKYGFAFIRILRSVKKREPVVAYYASLFDRGRDADPFLNNLAPLLRDPDQIIANELRSESPDVKILGLKALAMLTNRISSERLLDILISEEVKKVRLTIYKIVESSSVGTYPDLFYPILEIFCKTDKQEAFFAFKALMVSGKVPPYSLFRTIREKRPELLPAINAEISTLSRIAFFVIQDIALNREQYLTDNFDINLACVLGMIKKRPERIVKVLKKYDNESQDDIRMDVTGFIEKAKHLLAREKQSIENEFDAVVEEVQKASLKNKGLFESLFGKSGVQKLLELKANPSSQPLDFKGETIKDADLSGCSFISAPLFFNSCAITNCNFSKAAFSRTFFKGSIFYNVDMRLTRFESVNFDNAVLINVNAEGAVFDKCSFQNVSLFNCNFNDADMTDLLFLNAVISKTSFSQTDLSGSSFDHSRISAVSFVHSNLDQADFSDVRARFCRFPTNAKTIITSDGIDYNARIFQVTMKDMPAMDLAMISEINMMIFTEFVHYGEMKFLRQNQLSLLTAFDIFKPKQADFFYIIPYLLHENCPFAGAKDLNPKTPCGICEYLPNTETRDVLRRYIGSENIQVRRRKTYAIEGLFTIGSTGSLAQTSDSDIDYWVCIHEERFSSEEIQLLRQKLELLEQMALSEFATQVTFFIVDIKKAKNNDFGGSTVESSGSAQTRLLKEEFYRTMIYVAGKIPLWAVLPTPVGLNHYNNILNNISSIPHISRYIDLGDIHAISTSEYFGASIWQMFKWLKSPFKSVIKMALLEKYIFEYGRESLLCNKYKDEWMNSGTQLKLAQNDAYYILIKNLVRYYESVRDNDSVSLLLTCFFLKLGIFKDSQLDNTVFGLRKILLEKCMEKWGWSKDQVFDFGNFKQWRYSEIVSLSGTIEKYMIKKYKTVNKTFEIQAQDKSNISPEDRTVLGRKVLTEFSNQPGKVKKVLLVSQSDHHFQGLHLKYIKVPARPGTWELLNKSSKMHSGQEEPLIRANTIEEIGAWLINNHLYSETQVFNLIPNPTFVTHDDIRKLYKAMDDFFAPKLEKEIGFDQLLKKNYVSSLFISVNFYAPRQQRNVTEYTAVYLNSWGEMFCKSFYAKEGLPSMEAMKADILARIGIRKLPKDTAFYFSKGAAR